MWMTEDKNDFFQNKKGSLKSFLALPVCRHQLKIRSYPVVANILQKCKDSTKITMDWQVDTVTELQSHMDGDFLPITGLKWIVHWDVTKKMKGRGRRVDVAALEFSIKKSGKESGRCQTPSWTKVWQIAFQEK